METHGKYVIAEDGTIRYLGLRGDYAVQQDGTLAVWLHRAKYMSKLQEAIPEATVVTETHALVPANRLKELRKFLRMKRNVSPEGSERRRQRMREYWAQRKQQAASAQTPSQDDELIEEPDIQVSVPESPPVRTVTFHLNPQPNG